MTLLPPHHGEALLPPTDLTNMAAVCAELTLTDGQKLRVRVPVQSHLSSVLSAVNELSTHAARLLNELVERERTDGARAHGEEEDEENEEDEEPDMKRAKT